MKCIWEKVLRWDLQHLTEFDETWPPEGDHNLQTRRVKAQSPQEKTKIQLSPRLVNHTSVRNLVKETSKQKVRGEWDEDEMSTY